MEAHEEKVLQILRRKYNQYDTVNLLNKKCSELQVEIGKLKSYTYELEAELREVASYRKNIKAYKKSLKRSLLDEKITDQKTLITYLNDSLRKQKIEYNKLFTKHINLQVKHKDNEA